MGIGDIFRRRPKGLRFPNGIPRVADDQVDIFPEEEEPKAILRLWDKDFNLLGSWHPDEQIHITVDREDGSRFGGIAQFRVVDRDL